MDLESNPQEFASTPAPRHTPPPNQILAGLATAESHAAARRRAELERAQEGPVSLSPPRAEEGADDASVDAPVSAPASDGTDPAAANAPADGSSDRPESPASASTEVSDETA